MIYNTTFEATLITEDFTILTMSMKNVSEVDEIVYLHRRRPTPLTSGLTLWTSSKENNDT